MKRLLKRGALLLLAVHAVGLVGLVYLHFHQELLVYQAFPGIIRTPDEYGLRYETVFIETEDGERLHAWYLPHPDSRGAILYFHGNAGNISYRQKALTGLTKLGLDVLIFDYRGYGKSTGTPTEEGTYRDAEAAWRYLVEERKIPPARIVIWGRSLGGAVATYLASKVEPAALVLESTFMSLPSLALEMYPIPDESWVTVKYPTAKRIEDIHVPLLLAHSPEDDLIGMHHADALFEASGSKKKKRIRLSGGHGEGHLTELRYTDVVDGFLREAIPP